MKFARRQTALGTGIHKDFVTSTKGRGRSPRRFCSHRRRPSAYEQRRGKRMTQQSARSIPQFCHDPAIEAEWTQLAANKATVTADTLPEFVHAGLRILTKAGCTYGATSCRWLLWELNDFDPICDRIGPERSWLVAAHGNASNDFIEHVIKARFTPFQIYATFKQLDAQGVVSWTPYHGVIDGGGRDPDRQYVSNDEGEIIALRPPEPVMPATKQATPLVTPAPTSDDGSEPEPIPAPDCQYGTKDKHEKRWAVAVALSRVGWFQRGKLRDGLAFDDKPDATKKWLRTYSTNPQSPLVKRGKGVNTEYRIRALEENSENAQRTPIASPKNTIELNSGTRGGSNNGQISKAIGDRQAPRPARRSR